MFSFKNKMFRFIFSNYILKVVLVVDLGCYLEGSHENRKANYSGRGLRLYNLT